MKTPASTLFSFATAFLVAFGARSSSLLAQAESTTDPVGLIELVVNGTGGTQSAAFTFLGLGMTRAVAYQGMADTVSGATITSNSAAWTDNQFASTPAPGYFLEITSGPSAGLMTQVIGCNQNAKTLTVAENLTALGVASGVTYKLRKNWSLGSVFGAANEAGLGTGTSVTADLVLIWNPALGSGTGGYDQYFYQTSGFGGTGWRKIGGGVSTDQQNAVIQLDDGVVVKRLQAANLSFAVPGAVKLGPTHSPISVGTNFIGNVYPAGTLTLGNSSLYTSSNSTGVVGGTSTTADLVLIWNSSLASGAGGYEQYFYQTSGFGGTGWRKIGGGVSADQSGTVLAVGKSVVIKRTATGGPFTWVVPQPFPNP